MLGKLTYKQVIGIAIGIIGAAMSLYHMYAIAIAPPEAMIFRGWHLLFAIVLVFLIYPTNAKRGQGNPSWIDLGLVALSIAFIGYIFVYYKYIINRIYYIDDLLPADMVMAVLAVILVLEASRRAVDWMLPVTALAFVAHAFLWTGVDAQRFLDQMYMTTEGIFGSTLGVSAAFVVIFVMFGSFMERTGTGQLFMDFALALTGRQTGGPGKCSVISSSLFGTISGSAVANVMVDGPITLPLMKRSGFTPHFAAGVESTASTGGQIMPPVMGAAAFVMAEFMSVSYFQICMWAIIPSVLYYVACFAAVHFEAKRHGLRGLSREECPRIVHVLKERGHQFIPVAIVLVGMFNDYSAPLAALVGVLSCFPVAYLRKSTRHTVTWANIWGALVDSARNSLAVALACAAAGIMIGTIALTGLGITFTQLVLGLAEHSLFVALVITAMASLVLGLALPTTPSYILTVALLVPAIIKMGVVEPAAHMFAFYYAILSAITPPVALAVFAAASLAKADMWKSGWAAMKIGAAGFVVPFMFVYDPALLMIGEWPDILMATATASIGCILLASGLHGFLLRSAVMWERVALVSAALLLVNPNWVTDLVGAGLLVVVLIAQRAMPGMETPKPA
ncbi:MAG: TRAP transporter permease [Alphaproteobacteria bacterium]|nr:TRAP transporter permease [Alphaproteobacteria bacterium]